MGKIFKNIMYYFIRFVENIMLIIVIALFLLATLLYQLFAKK